MRTKLVYISGGDSFSPGEIKSALDEIRRTLNLPEDMVLFGLPVDDLTEKEPDIRDKTQDHKILQFPDVKRKSILNVIAPSAEDDPEEMPDEIKLSDEILMAPDDGGEESSITDLLDTLPSMNEDELPIKSNSAKDLAEEFGDFLDRDEEKSPTRKKAKSFGRKTRMPFSNLLGDLFSYAGIAANDDSQDFTLPDFIKRP
jgi:hypothetical protein